jgi:hypothetical protein
MYLYKTTIYKSLANVIGADPNNDVYKTDFETDCKATANRVTSVIIAETTFETALSYTDFKAKIVLPLTWMDVKYTENNTYILYLSSNNPI